MPNSRHMLMVSVALLAPLPWAPTAMAEDIVVSASPIEMPAPARLNPLGGKLLSNGALAAKRGGTDTQIFNDMKLKGIVSDNQATNVLTGSNFISDGAFTGANGLPMVIQNSGNNVLIQNATIVNVQVK